MVCLWFLTIGLLSSCSINGIYYKNKGNRTGTLTSIKLKEDSTAIYTYWKDIKLKKVDKWISSGDTIQTHKMEFIHKGNKLIQENGTVWKKRMIVFNKKMR